MTELIETPCVAICRTENGICIGCGRTVEEITEWWEYTDKQRQTVMDRLEKETNDLFN